MTIADRISAIRDGPVEAVLAEYFDRVDRGERVELSGIIAAHPGCEEGVRRFLDQERKLQVAMDAVAPVPSPDGLAGRTLGDFRLIRELGRGGMGIVCEAEQVSLRRKVAVKVLPSGVCADPRHRTRFQNEARILAQLEHPNIVSVIAVGEEANTTYFAMQYIDGMTVDELIRMWEPSPLGRGQGEGASSSALPHPGPLPEGEGAAPTNGELSGRLPQWIGQRVDHRERYRTSARIAAEVAEGLAHAHACGVLHRDVKPSNILLDKTGAARLTDFGLARMYGDATLTATGTMLGTLRYASPEQLRGTTAGVDERSDVYSLGVTLWELVTGKRLFVAEDRNSVISQVLSVEAPRASLYDARVPRDLETVIARAAAKEPGDRYISAQAFADDLRRFLDGRPIEAKPLSRLERGFRWANRNRVLATSAVGSLIVLAAVALVASALVLRANTRTTAALAESQTNEVEAQEQAGAAEASERKTRELLYASDMALAGAAWKKNEPAQVRMLLDRYAMAKTRNDGSTEEDSRGFEWHFLDRQTRRQSEVLFRNDQALYLIDFMPNGKEFYTAGQDSIVRWHETSRGKVLRSLDTQQREVNGVSYNPAGTMFATAGDDGTVKICDATSLTLLQTIRADHGICWFAKFVDDHRVFTGGDMISQQLFDATNGKRIREFVSPDATAPGVVSAGSNDAHISRTTDRAWTRTGSQDNRYDGIYEWEFTTGKSRKVYKNNHIRRLLADSSERYFILIEAGGYVRIVDALRGIELWSTKVGNSLEALALSLDEGQLAVGDHDGQIYIWKLDLDNPDSLVTSTAPEKIALHDRQVYSVVFAPDGKSILAASRDGSAKRATLATRVEPYRQLGWLTSKADCAAIPGTNFVVATPPVAIYDRSTGKLINELSSHAHRILTVSADGNLIAAASPSQIEIWNRITGGLLNRIVASQIAAKSLDFSPSSQLLAVCGDDINVKDFDKPHGRVEVIEAATGTSTRYPVPGNEAVCARFCAGDGLIGLCAGPNQIALWNVPDGHIRWQTSSTGARYYKVALSPDRLYLVAAQRRSLQLIECATGNIRHEVPCEFSIASIAVLSDGRSFVVGGTEGQLSVWNTATGQPLFEIADLGKRIDSIVPLDDGFLASTTQVKADRTERVWFEF